MNKTTKRFIFYSIVIGAVLSVILFLYSNGNAQQVGIGPASSSSRGDLYSTPSYTARGTTTVTTSSTFTVSEGDLFLSCGHVYSGYTTTPSGQYSQLAKASGTATVVSFTGGASPYQQHAINPSSTVIYGSVCGFFTVTSPGSCAMKHTISTTGGSITSIDNMLAIKFLIKNP